MSWQFTVGLRMKGKADRIVVDAEDALIAALTAKVSGPRPQSCMCGGRTGAVTHVTHLHPHRRLLILNGVHHWMIRR